jgi:site-specific recombinase XerD
MPLGSAACEVLWKYLRERAKVAPNHREELWVEQSGHGLSRPAWLYLLIKRLGKAAGIPDLYTHRFRHSYAMNALRGGMPMPVLEWTGGWSRIPETYLRTLGMDEARRFHQQVSPGDRLGRPRQRGRPGSGRGRL